jgi:hypothetical protein
MAISPNIRFLVLSTHRVHTNFFSLSISSRRGRESWHRKCWRESWDISVRSYSSLKCRVSLILSPWDQSCRNPSSRGSQQDVCSSETQLPHYYTRYLDHIWCLYLGCPHSLRQHARSVEGAFSSIALIDITSPPIYLGFLGLDWSALGWRKACRKICWVLCFDCWVRWRPRIYGVSKYLNSGSPWNHLCPIRL